MFVRMSPPHFRHTVLLSDKLKNGKARKLGWKLNKTEDWRSGLRSDICKSFTFPAHSIAGSPVLMILSLYWVTITANEFSRTCHPGSSRMALRLMRLPRPSRSYLTRIDTSFTLIVWMKLANHIPVREAIDTLFRSLLLYLLFGSWSAVWKDDQSSKPNMRQKCQASHHFTRSSRRSDPESVQAVLGRSPVETCLSVQHSGSSYPVSHHA